MTTTSRALHGVLRDVLDRVPHATGAVAYGITSDGARSHAALGVADPRDGRRMTTDATFRIASSTKTFTAATVLRLHERGDLEIDDLVGRFLTREIVDRMSVIDGVSYGPQITVRHLLTHTAGLAEVDGESFLDVLFSQPDKRWTPWEKIELCIGAGSPSFVPGAEAKYCDVGYVILAMIVERVAAVPLALAFRSLLRFEELRLTSIHLESLEPVPSGAGPRVRHFMRDRDVTDIDPSCDLWGGGAWSRTCTTSPSSGGISSKVASSIDMKRSS